MNQKERNEAISSIKLSLKRLFSFSNMKFSDFVLTDGSKITTPSDDLSVGAEIYAIDDMGNQTPLDDGDYVINDGRTITVEDNVIKSVTDDSDDTEDESPMSDANTSNMSKSKDKSKDKDQKTGQESKMADGMPDGPSDESDLCKRITDIENQIEEILNLLGKMSEASASTTEQMMSAIRKFSDEPGDTSIKHKKTGFEQYNSKKINAKKNMEEILELRKLVEQKHKRDNNMSL